MRNPYQRYISIFERQREVVFARLRNLPNCSHLGSSDIKLFIDPADVASRLGDSSDGLVHAWRKTELRKFADNADVPPVYSLSPDEKKTCTIP